MSPMFKDVYESHGFSDPLLKKRINLRRKKPFDFNNSQAIKSFEKYKNEEKTAEYI